MERVRLDCPGCTGAYSNWNREGCPVCHGAGKVEERVPGPIEAVVLRLFGGAALALFVVVSVVVIAIVVLAYVTVIVGGP